MARYRIGNDMTVVWSIYDHTGAAYYLKGKEVRLYYTCERGRFEADFEIQGTNKVVWSFWGREQKVIGDYTLSLEIIESAGKRRIFKDYCNAFTLVGKSCEEAALGNPNISEDGNIVLSSKLDVYKIQPIIPTVGSNSNWFVDGADTGKPSTGKSAYEYAKEKGYEGTESEYAESLKLAPENSEKLAELSAETETIRTEVESQNQLIEDLQNTKIEKEADDYYPQLSVGVADNLAGVDVVDSEINFRRSGGGAISDGVARIESIKGNSVVWNMTGVKDSIKSAASTNQEHIVTQIKQNHKYVVLVEQQNTMTANTRNAFYVEGGQSESSLANYNLTKGTRMWLFAVTNAPTNLRLWVHTPDVEVTYQNFRLFDLTQMFGAGHEPTTIEEFYQRIPMGVDLNAYNKGEVIHMDVQSIESQGVNAWDEKIESGYIDTTNGNKVDTTNGNKVGTSDAYRRSVNMIEVISGAEYYINATGARLFFYDADGNFILYYGMPSGQPGKFSVPSNACFLAFFTQKEYYKTDICINLSDASINGKYFPYIKRVEDLSVIRKYFPNGMKSAGTAHDEIRYNKTTNKWEKVVRIGEVKMKDLKWAFNGGTPSKFSALGATDMVSADGVVVDLMCKRYSSASSATATDKSIYRAGAYIGVWDSAYSDLASFSASLTDEDIIYYQLAEPIVTELDEADQFKDLDYQVWNDGTEKAIAEGKSAPLAADITYGFNAIGKIKELESLVAALRAKVGI